MTGKHTSFDGRKCCLTVGSWSSLPNFHHLSIINPISHSCIESYQDITAMSCLRKTTLIGWNYYFTCRMKWTITRESVNFPCSRRQSYGPDCQFAYNLQTHTYKKILGNIFKTLICESWLPKSDGKMCLRFNEATGTFIICCLCRGIWGTGTSTQFKVTCSMHKIPRVTLTTPFGYWLSSKVWHDMCVCQENNNGNKSYRTNRTRSEKNLRYSHL